MRISALLVAFALICLVGAGENTRQSPSDKPFDRAVKILQFGQVNEYFEPAKGDAVAFLGLLGDERAVPVLVEHLANEQDSNLRFQITKALGWTKSRKAVPALDKALKDDDVHVRNGAAMALTRITGQQHRIEKTPIPAAVLQELAKGLATLPKTDQHPGMTKPVLGSGKTYRFALMQPQLVLIGKVLDEPANNWVKIQTGDDKSVTTWVNLAAVAYVQHKTDGK